MATPRSDFDSLQRDLSALRQDFSALIDSLRAEGQNGYDAGRERIGAGISDISDRAGRLYDEFSERGQEHLHAVQRQIEERPVLAVAAAFAVGFLASRLFDRR